jgi:hypothetical protein
MDRGRPELLVECVFLVLAQRAAALGVLQGRSTTGRRRRGWRLMEKDLGAVNGTTVAAVLPSVEQFTARMAARVRRHMKPAVLP